jgi:low affinity Fe/Cu permease
MREFFRQFAHAASRVVGSPWAFLLAVSVIVFWGITGPVFGFSDTWQLVINTGTSVVTFLMVFLIQNTQNRDTAAIQLKLDELLRGVKGARTGLVGLEELSDDDLDKLHRQFEQIRKKRERADGHARTRTAVTSQAAEENRRDERRRKAS